MNPTFVVIFGALVAVRLASGVNENTFNTYLAQIRSPANTNSLDEAIFALADCYHYVNSNRGETPNGHHYRAILDSEANRIGIEAFESVFRRTREEMPRLSNDEPYAGELNYYHAYHTLLLFSRVIRSLDGVTSRQLNMHDSMEILGNQLRSTFRPLCNLFNYPTTNYDDDEVVKFARLAYLSLEFARLNRLMRNLFGRATQQIGLACEQILELDNRVQLEETTIVHHEANQTTIEEIVEANDICTKLAIEELGTLSSRFEKSNIVSLFANDCLSDLAERWLRAFNTPERQKYQGALINRWLMRLEEYVEHSDGDDIFSDGDGYLQRLVNEVPAMEAVQAYKQGAGLCSMIDEKEFVTIWNHFEFVKPLSDNLGHKSVQEKKVDVSNLIRFKYLRTVCLIRRRKYQRSLKQSPKPSLKRSRQQFESQ